jgi:hypothetical protein
MKTDWFAASASSRVVDSVLTIFLAAGRQLAKSSRHKSSFCVSIAFLFSSAVCSNCLSDCLVEQVAVLLHRIMADNPKLASLYTTGVFFFILMYTGSNLLPIGRFLAISHDKQAFRSQS